MANILGNLTGIMPFTLGNDTTPTESYTPPGFGKKHRMQVKAGSNCRYVKLPKPLTRQVRRQLERMSYDDPRRPIGA